jgi:hypothetical protein
MRVNRVDPRDAQLAVGHHSQIAGVLSTMVTDCARAAA